MRTTSHFFPKLPRHDLTDTSETPLDATGTANGPPLPSYPHPLDALSRTPLTPHLPPLAPHHLHQQFPQSIQVSLNHGFDHGFNLVLQAPAPAPAPAPIPTIWNHSRPDPRDLLGASPLWFDDGEFDLPLDLSIVDDDDPVLTVSFTESKPQFMKTTSKPNIYSSKVNTPVFVPDSQVQLSDPFGSELLAGGDNRNLPSFPPTPPTIPSAAPRIILKLVDHDVGAGTNLSSLQATTPQTSPTPLKYLSPHPVPVVLLPKMLNKAPTKLPDFDHLVMALKNGELYLEDYCLTFYKRNDHGYMFIREPTTLLKVNYTGSRQWVQVKVKMPGVSKKTKVNIKNLPVWKPLSLNPVVNKRKDKRRRWKRFQLV